VLLVVRGSGGEVNEGSQHEDRYIKAKIAFIFWLLLLSLSLIDQVKIHFIKKKR
jgi:hypothetical protein